MESDGLHACSTLALTSPYDVHHSVNLSNTKFITYIYTSFYHFFSEKKTKHLYLNILKMSIQTFPLDFFRRWTGPPIHANQNNHTTTKNIVLVWCFLTVLCHIVNRSYMLNTVQHSYMIMKFFSVQTKKKPNRAEILNKAQLCVTQLFTLFQFLPQKC